MRDDINAVKGQKKEIGSSAPLPNIAQPPVQFKTQAPTAPKAGKNIVLTPATKSKTRGKNRLVAILVMILVVVVAVGGVTAYMIMGPL